MKTLKFRAQLKAPILNGEKTSTWRLFDDKNLSIGDELTFIVWETGETFARAKIISVKETMLGKLTKEDWEGHETYASEQEMYKHYSTYYKRPVDKNTLLKIVKFKLLEKLA